MSDFPLTFALDDRLSEEAGRVIVVLSAAQNIACEYGTRHPKGPCDCKFGPAIEEESLNPGLSRMRTTQVGRLRAAESWSSERTGCPELRTAIEMVSAWPRLLAMAVARGWVHRTWRGCGCEQCVEFRKAAGLR